MSDLLRYLVARVDGHRDELEAAGLGVAIEVGPPGSDSSAAWVDLDSDARMVRFTLWETGEATLDVADIASGDILANEQRLVSGAFGVEQSLTDAVAWAKGPAERAGDLAERFFR